MCHNGDDNGEQSADGKLLEEYTCMFPSSNQCDQLQKPPCDIEVCSTSSGMQSRSVMETTLQKFPWISVEKKEIRNKGKHSGLRIKNRLLQI